MKPFFNVHFRNYGTPTKPLIRRSWNTSFQRLVFILIVLQLTQITIISNNFSIYFTLKIFSKLSKKQSRLLNYSVDEKIVIDFFIITSIIDIKHYWRELNSCSLVRFGVRVLRNPWVISAEPQGSTEHCIKKRHWSSAQTS